MVVNGDPSAGLGLATLPAGIVMTRNQLLLPPYALRPGRAYTVVLQVTAQGSGQQVRDGEEEEERVDEGEGGRSEVKWE